MRIRDEFYQVKHLGPLMNIYLMPDCHFGSPAFLEEEYERLASIIEKDPYAKIIFQGDILDSNRPSTRHIKQVSYHDRMEEYAQSDERNEFWFIENILPKLKRIIKSPDRCLGLMDGDHYMLMSSGMTSTQVLASRLKVPYLGDGQALLKLHFTYAQQQRANIVLHVQHGIGGGGRAGSGVNRLEDVANSWEGVDVFFRGHSHKGFIFPVSKYYSCHKNNEIRQRDIWLINTPSFRTGYILNKTDYAESRCYGATAHKYPRLKLWTDKSKSNNNTFRVNITAELI